MQQLLDDIKPADWKFRLIRSIKRLMFLFCHFPALDLRFIHSNIDRLQTSPHEREAYYESNSSSGLGQKALMVLIYSLYCCKNFYITFMAFSLFNYEHPERTITRAAFPLPPGSLSSGGNSDYTLKSAACMTTDCERLAPWDVDNDIYRSLARHASRATLADDFNKLPLFHICHPLIDKFYTPVDKLDSFGVLAFTCSAFNVLLLGVCTNLQQLLFPAPNEMIFFLVAPSATTRLALDRTAELARDVTTSYRNFCTNSTSAFRDSMRFRDFELFRKCSWILSCDIGAPAHGLSLIPSTILGRRGCDLTAKSSTGASLAGTQMRFRHLRQRSSTSISAHRKSEPETSTAAAVAARGSWSSAVSDGATRLSVATTSEAMPIIRTGWWREICANNLLTVLPMTVSVACAIGVFCFAYIQYRIIKKRQLLVVMAQEMAKSNCSIWLTEDLLKLSTNGSTATSRIDDQFAHANPTNPPRLQTQAKPIDVANLNLTWSLYAMLETSLMNLGPGICVALILAYYAAMISEIMVWLAEVRMYLVASLVVLNLRLPSSLDSPGLEITDGRNKGDTILIEHRNIITSHVYNMGLLRRKFQQETCFFAGFVYYLAARHPNGFTLRRSAGSGIKYIRSLINSRKADRTRQMEITKQIIETSLDSGNHHHHHHHHHHHRQSASVDELSPLANGGGCGFRGRCRNQEDDDDDLGYLRHDIETLEKIYINFRLFIEHIRNSEPGNATVFSIFYVLNYGLAVIGVICQRKMQNLKQEPLFFIVVGMLIANILIFVGANFHADAKKLQPIIWSMIAKMTHSKNQRVRHLRFLWLKQVQILDDQGGLALSALRMRVTYINILQLAIWTATIIIIAIH